jgi:hypothetical protein
MHAEAASNALIAALASPIMTVSGAYPSSGNRGAAAAAGAFANALALTIFA